MNHSLIAALVAGAVLVGCSSKGEAGPVGPSGPTGPSGPRGDQGSQGLQGSPGQPGESVLSAQLGLGSVDCPHGGSQFTSVSGTTFACNGVDGATGAPGAAGTQGAPGPSGPPGGPRLLAKSAAGLAIGPILGLPSPDGALPIYIVALDSFVMLNRATGKAPYCNGIIFESANCAGTQYNSGSYPPPTLCDSGNTLWTYSGAPRTITMGSYLKEDGTCGQQVASMPNVFLAVPIVNLDYPYASPVTWSYE